MDLVKKHLLWLLLIWSCSLTAQEQQLEDALWRFMEQHEHQAPYWNDSTFWRSLYTQHFIHRAQYDSIQQVGKLHSVYQVYQLPIDPALLQALWPYFQHRMQRSNSNGGLLKTSVKGRDMDPQAWTYALNYRQRRKHWQWSLSSEQDALEQWQVHHQQLGADYWSAQVNYQRDQLQVHFGDYKLNLGQGLVSFQSFSRLNHKSASGIQQYRAPFQAHQNNDEQQFFRGIAYAQKHNNWHWSASIDRRQIDGRLENKTLKWRISGIHHSDLELAERQALLRHCAHAQVGYGGKASRWSVYALAHRVQDDNQLVHEAWYGLHGQHQIGGTQLFHELAFDGQSHAAIIGMQQSWSDRVHYDLLLRAVGNGYRSTYGQFFAASSGAEIGVFQQWTHYITKRQQWRATLDLSQQPAEIEYYHRPHQRSAFSFSYDHRAKQGPQYHLAWRHQYEQELDAQVLQRVHGQQFKAKLQFPMHERLSWLAEAQYAQQWPTKQRSYLLSQAIRYKGPHWQWSLRMNYFAVPEGGQLLYAYNEVPQFNSGTRVFSREGMGLNALLAYRWRGGKWQFLWRQQWQQAEAEELQYSTYWQLQCLIKLR